MSNTFRHRVRLHFRTWRELQAKLGQPFSGFEITVIYVGRFDDRAIGGRGGHIAYRPACFVGANAGP